MQSSLEDIKEYEGRYAVTMDGKVWSYRSNRWLAQFKTKDGYLRVSLCRGYEMRGFLVHRLVAQAYIQNSEHLPIVNHIDNNPSNNSVENLEWCTQKGNIGHSVRQGRHAKGEKVHTSKLTEPQALEIKKRDKSARILAKKFGVSRSQIWSIWRGESWAHL